MTKRSKVHLRPVLFDEFCSTRWVLKANIHTDIFRFRILSESINCHYDAIKLDILQIKIRLFYSFSYIFSTILYLSVIYTIDILVSVKQRGPKDEEFNLQ